ncbi:MAG: cobalamin-dependent protein [Acidimicrobiia bacterium]|nr:cobalamin-dependent protein [Acidimicrobiia bacterium]
MKVTFVYPDFFQYADGSYFPEARLHLGLCMLSRQLKDAGHGVDLIHLVRPWEREELVSEVKVRSPDVLAFSATTMMYPKVRVYSQWVKEAMPDLPTVCGGTHAQLDPEDIVPGTPAIDLAVRGEGDFALPELVDALEAGQDPLTIDNVWGRRGEDVVRNPVRPLITDLDSLPFADRDLFDDALLCEDQRERGTVMACRGCPYNCTYCSNHIQRLQYPNRKVYVRFRSVDHVIAELHWLRQRSPGLRFIRFDDDILTWDTDWFTEFCTRYKTEIGLPFVCNAFVNLLDDETIAMFADAGCEVMAMGIESGNPWLRGRILHRHMTNDDIIRVYQACRAHGIKTVSTNMVAMPHETLDMVLDTIKVNARAEPDTMQVSVFYPFPNTHMYDICAEEGYLTDGHRDSFFCDSVLTLPGYDEPEMVRARENMHLLTQIYSHFNRLPDPLRNMAARAVDALFLSERIPRGLRLRVLDGLLDRERAKGPLEFVKY